MESGREGGKRIKISGSSSQAQPFIVSSMPNYQQAEDISQAQQQQHEEEGKLVDVRLIHESVGRDLKCNSCQRHVPKSLKHSILCHKYSPHGPPGTRLYRCFTSCPNCFNEWELWPNNRDADSFNVLSGATYQTKSEKTIEEEMESGREGVKRIQPFGSSSRAQGQPFIVSKPNGKLRIVGESEFLNSMPRKRMAMQHEEEEEEGKLVDVRLIHESVGRDLKCNSCQHHVPRSLKHSILCRKYEGPPGTRLYRCFTSCPNCFDEWELRPNNRYADSFDVLSGATYQEIIPNSGQM